LQEPASNQGKAVDLIGYRPLFREITSVLPKVENFIPTPGDGYPLAFCRFLSPAQVKKVNSETTDARL
jgi:hypothetical protein